MRVIAARFPDTRRASAALSTLRRRLPLPPQDAAIAPLGTPGETSEGQALLAGRFREAHADVLAEVVRKTGGEIVANVDERWTLPRSPGTTQATSASTSVASRHDNVRRRGREPNGRRWPVTR